MRIRSLFVVLVLLLVAGFVTLNWPAITAETRLSFLVATLDAPIGLVMLGMLALVVLAFGLYIVVWQSAMLVDTRRQSKALEAQRSLADQAEASRLSELRSAVHEDIERLAARIEQMQDEIHAEMRNNANSVSATIGELDDRLQRQRGPAP